MLTHREDLSRLPRDEAPRCTDCRLHTAELTEDGWCPDCAEHREQLRVDALYSEAD